LPLFKSNILMEASSLPLMMMLSVICMHLTGPVWYKVSASCGVAFSYGSGERTCVIVHREKALAGIDVPHLDRSVAGSAGNLGRVEID
jgi:hypothetical protein